MDRQIPPNLWDGFLLALAGAKATDAIDFAVGISAIKKIGEHAERNEPLMIVHARNQTSPSSVLPFLDCAVAIE